PFDQGSGDIVLRSCDQVDFYLYQWTLSSASPFFQTMFSLPQNQNDPSSRSPEGCPIVDMAEDTPTIRMLLQFCYPRTLCPKPTLDSVADLKRCLTLGNKFDIDIIRVAAQKSLMRLAQSQPETAYFIAWSFQMRDAVLSSAQASVHHPFLLQETEEMSEVPALALARLYRFRTDCNDRLSSL
ncbi:hypothetical protein K488DRAFT_35741, partial [Vararia minispora EC-137]